jgi:Cu/Zn superoxide dismutase
MKAVSLWACNRKSRYSYSIIPNLKGFVYFVQENPSDDVKVIIYVNGLPDALHGIHIHEKSMSELKDVSGNCCEQLGGHFNVGESWSLTTPHGKCHGQHNGDLCMNIMSKNNKAYFCYYDSKISLFKSDERCILNRSVVIHEDPDDLGKEIYTEEDKNIASLINGNAGKRVACSEIREIKDPNF